MDLGIKRWDIIRADFSNAIGSEQGKIRLAVVIQNDVGNLHSPTTIVIPLTHVKKKLYIPTHALIEKTEENGLTIDSVALAEQMRVICKSRILNRVGSITKVEDQKKIRDIYEASFGE